MLSCVQWNTHEIAQLNRDYDLRGFGKYKEKGGEKGASFLIPRPTDRWPGGYSGNRDPLASFFGGN